MKFWKLTARESAGVTASTESGERTYRVALIGDQGVVASMVQIRATDDDEACKKAKALVDGHAVDLWEGLRFVDHFPATDLSK
ncbi:hypothetical protein [Methylobacterium iners]|uniref:BON domain-containing protein n=1 Tax=Methylobacterium iners TaxID=418707 RepID=A0ABQ4RUW6_9HYPH|nr:hypothetical protein [Methylobacterium iners]GJD94509.1 hypothetical protein OCOJLMKI_1711 [Methylobacterium iners]